MLMILVCSVIFIGGSAAPYETEVCQVVKTRQTLNAYCQFVSSSAHAADRQVTFCRVYDGRVKPAQYAVRVST